MCMLTLALCTIRAKERRQREILSEEKHWGRKPYFVYGDASMRTIAQKDAGSERFCRKRSIEAESHTLCMVMLQCALLQQKDAGSERFCWKRSIGAESHTLCMVMPQMRTIAQKDAGSERFCRKRSSGAKGYTLCMPTPQMRTITARGRWQREILSQEKQPSGKAYYVYADACAVHYWGKRSAARV